MFSSEIKTTIQQAAKALTGYKRRAFMAQVAKDYFNGNARQTEEKMGWGREAILLGLNELRTGILCLDNFAGRGNKRTEERFPGLEESIREIVEPHTQADPDFKNPYSYLKITAKSVRNALLNKGYTEEQLPTQPTIGNILNRMNYSLKRVQKKTS
jgi:Rhodopirellula transposase DDE domain